MEINLIKKPKNPTILEGFPGFGLIGTITTEYLIDHLKTELIGTIWIPEMPALAAIHENKLIQPIGLFYSKEHNIVIVHVITSATGFEWKLCKAVRDVAEMLQAKEILSLEGVGSAMPVENPAVFYFTTEKNREKDFKKLKISPLGEGIIMGVTASILLREDKLPVSALFVEAQSNLPDSKAAAKIIETLDKLFGLDVDPKPLLEQAEKFEGKIKNLLDQAKFATQEQKKKMLSYVG
ncbi:proteasome assembly chaperone family protein [Candidatus Woesearchaeota archaeon]|nr:proteasome assembly chaperone family protein [Candidatus Woesearchaeota archaeon]